MKNNIKNSMVTEKWTLFSVQLGIIAASALYLPCILSAGEEASGEIIITAPSPRAETDNSGRFIEILDNKMINSSRAFSPAELLSESASINISERGGQAVQSDLSIRGCSFQQVLITIDGIPFMDHQTAHHNMDLPFPASALEQITISPGVGTAPAGPAAFGGTIDMTTRVPSKSGSSVKFSYGDFDTRNIAACLDFVTNGISTTISSMRSSSDGFSDGIDYTVWSAWGSVRAENDIAGLRISAGYTDKDFGAQDFYGSYPSRELTSVTLLDLAPEMLINQTWKIKSAFRYRRHEDEFILKRDDPDYYRNLHTSEDHTERVALNVPDMSWGNIETGAERIDSMLESSNIGDRKEHTSSMFIQHNYVRKKSWSVNTGLRIDKHSRWGTETTPSFSGSFNIFEAFRLRGGCGRAIRPPSFTELYYSDPANEGNSNLIPEEAIEIEGGLDLNFGENYLCSATYFNRDVEDMIAWTRESKGDPWQASNTGRIRFRGTELTLSGKTGVLKWKTSYQHINADENSPGYESKYALIFAEDNIVMGMECEITGGISAGADVRYRDLNGLNDHTLAGIMLSWQKNGISIFSRITNLLDEDYEEIPDVPTAGRAVKIGMEMEI